MCGSRRRVLLLDDDASVRSGAGELLPFLGPSDMVRAFEKAARRLAESDRPILILGEPGTGKKLLARWIHANSPRSTGAFVGIQCAGLTGEGLEGELFGGEGRAGLLDRSHRGTLFLNEIADVDSLLLPRLLEAFESGCFQRPGEDRKRSLDTRLIAATRHHLGGMVRDGRFHAELYFRLQTVPLHVPPLRERRQDIPLLASALIETLAMDHGRGPVELTSCALHALQGHRWPGNLRELFHVLEAAVLRSESRRIDARALRLDADGISRRLPLPPVGPFRRRAIPEA